MAEEHAGDSGISASFGSTRVGITGKYLPYFLLGLLALLVPAIISMWQMQEIRDGLLKHRVEVARFLSEFRGEESTAKYVAHLISAY